MSIGAKGSFNGVDVAQGLDKGSTEQHAFVKLVTGGTFNPNSDMADREQVRVLKQLFVGTKIGKILQVLWPKG